MTYVIAWKSKSEVFLTADSALTTRSPSLELTLSQSSFGQEHLLDTERKVEERALKLFLKEKIGIGLAGRYDLAIKAINAFYEKIQEGLSPIDALKWAVFLIQPFPQDTTIQLAVGYYDDGPRLISFNSQGDCQIRDDEEIVHLGSAPPGYKRINEEWVKDIIRKIDQPKAQIASMLGVLQSHGMLNPTLQAGIGGAFAGLYIGESGGNWQPDILFVEDDKLASVSIINDCLVVNSPTIGQSRCFLTYLPPRSLESLKDQTTKAIEEAKRVMNSAEYDYLIFISTKYKSITLIEMNKHKQHELVWLEPFIQPDGHSGTKISIFPQLRRLIDRQIGGIAVATYRSPSTQEVSKDKIINKIVRNPD